MAPAKRIRAAFLAGVKKTLTYPGAVLAAGFVYGVLEGILGLGAKPGGVSPAENFVLALMHRCLFYTLVVAVIGLVVWSAAGAVRALRRGKGPAPTRAAVAGMFGCAGAANLFWTALALLKLKRFTLGGAEFNAWEPAGFFSFFFAPLVLLTCGAGFLLYKVFGKFKRPGRALRASATAALAGWAFLIIWFLVRQATEPRPAADYPDVVLITLDAWRADTFGPRADGTSLTPHLDRFGEKAYVFRHARAQSSWTLPSFATIFTSQYPAVHGAAFDRPLGTSQPTLAGILAAHGYDTRAVVANELCLPSTGIPRGFASYHFWNMIPVLKTLGYYDTNLFYPGLRPPRTEKPNSRVTTVLTDATLKRLERRGGRPFFLWLHYLDPHGPYWPPAEFVEDPELLVPFAGKGYPRDKRAAILRARYEAEVSYVDAEVGRLLARLAERPHTVVIITSDHGEEFLEHGGLDHGHTMYEELLRVPLIMRFPDHPGGILNTPVDTIDLAPTLLEYLGMNSPPSMQGRSLWPVIYDTGVERPSFAGPTQLKGPRKEAVYYRGRKFVYDYQYPDAGVWYDLVSDPGERWPRSPTDSAGAELWGYIASWRNANREFRRKYRAAARDRSLRGAMKAMGYIN